MSDQPITIFHYPACGVSRRVLDVIETAGHTPKIVEYRKVGWTVEQLKSLLARMGQPPRHILRLKGASEAATAAAQAATSDEALITAMVAYPELVERPIVVSPKGAVLGRPVEAVEALL